ncbi:hypothetical protein [Rhizobium sp. FY34]|uniref:hypothetical protein n=1 Tax=Rhizobium sp. FY34 TaxID=2562309 RepID=UPI0014859A3C|nr:hypothetical protein [Rhizobium sp. FY34]
MTSAEQAVENAMAAVAASRALRERAAEDRKTFHRIQLASMKPLYVPKGVQMSFNLS